MSAKEVTKSILETESEDNTSILEVVSSPTLNKSQKIRTLHSKGLDRGVIAGLLGIRYQHVRNVLITPLTGTK